MGGLVVASQHASQVTRPEGGGGLHPGGSASTGGLPPGASASRGRGVCIEGRACNGGGVCFQARGRGKRRGSASRGGMHLRGWAPRKHYRLRSTSGRYASYWNAFLLKLSFEKIQRVRFQLFVCNIHLIIMTAGCYLGYTFQMQL